MLKYTIKTLAGPVVIRECKNKTCWCFRRLSSFDQITYHIYEDYLKCKDKNGDYNKIYNIK